MKLTNEELELINGLNQEFGKCKGAIADAEIAKMESLTQLQQIKIKFSEVEKSLIDKYGKESVINLQTGEVTKKE
jgi:hypothetical protein